MKYDIRTYREEYLDDHAKIEADERNRWEGGGQADKDQLKTNLARRYAQPDFDPETRLYAFEGEKMVGFITSSIYEEEGVTKGDLRIPFVVEGHEDARDPLLERAIEVLKTKGATSIRVMVSEDWGETVAVAKKNGFKFDKEAFIESQKRFDEIDEKKLLKPKDVQTFDYQKHVDDLTKFLMKQYNVSDEEARPIADRYKDWAIGGTKDPFGFPQMLVFQGLIIDKEAVVGRVLGFQQEQTGEKTVDLSITAEDNNKETIGQLLAAGIRESQKLGMEELHITIAGPTKEIKGLYTSYGLEFRATASFYTKKL